MIAAAGVLLLTKENRVLFLKRGAGGDFAESWCFPGGKIEDGETAEIAAARETVEETGSLPKGARALLTRQVRAATIAEVPSSIPPDSVDYSTFLQRVDEEYTPTLGDGEHTGWCWAPADSPPEPLHPGCRTALARLTMDELGVARAMSAGELTSPQRYENVWLFDMRITGTGVAYRSRGSEYVFRRPEDYLNDEFLARCNGLSVILEHPEKSLLNHKEYDKRAVGAIFLPYIKGDEVWGVAKIYDDTVAEMMMTDQLSTSPAVHFRDLSVNTSMTTEAGDKLLIEGKPSLLDHLAICVRGVWDKGGSPAGVNSIAIGDSDMTDEEKARKDAEDKAKMDAAKADGEKLDKVLSCIADAVEGISGLKSRMDAMEDKFGKADKKDSEEDRKSDDDDMAKQVAADKKDSDDKAAAEKAKSDSEEEVKKIKADSAAALEAFKADTAKQIADLVARMPKQMTDAERGEMANAQAKADSVMNSLGSRAPRPLDGEDTLGYRRRLANDLKAHSKTWKEIDLGMLSADAFAVAEGQVYADALVSANSPADLPDDQLREVRKTDPQTGRVTIEFLGSPRAWLNPHSAPRQFFKGMSPRSA